MDDEEKIVKDIFGRKFSENDLSWLGRLADELAEAKGLTIEHLSVAGYEDLFSRIRRSDSIGMEFLFEGAEWLEKIWLHPYLDEIGKWFSIWPQGMFSTYFAYSEAETAIESFYAVNPIEEIIDSRRDLVKSIDLWGTNGNYHEFIVPDLALAYVNDTIDIYGQDEVASLLYSLTDA